MLTRRGWLVSSAALAASQAQSTSKEVVIASGNGVRACDRALEMIRRGADTLDAVVAGVNINEDDPEDNSVGYGGLPNEQGVVELDASVMHGPTRRCGSVASLRNIKNPSKVAKLVMEQTDHIMLVGQRRAGVRESVGLQGREPADREVATGMDGVEAVAARQRRAQQLDRRARCAESEHALRFPGVDEETLAWAYEVARHPITGTINCLGTQSPRRNVRSAQPPAGCRGRFRAGSATRLLSARAFIVDQEVGAAGSTGRGEENIRDLRRAHHRREHAPRHVAEGCMPGCAEARSRGTTTTIAHGSTSSTSTSTPCEKTERSRAHRCGTA